MKAINIAYLKLDLKAKVLDYNEYFSKLFCMEEASLKHQAISDIPAFSLYSDYLNRLQDGDKRSYMLFKNNKTEINETKNAMLVIYTVVERYESYYLIRCINWLNWLHAISSSLEHGYSFMSLCNANIHKSSFSQISDASCYKAFYPLITYIPQKFSSGVSQVSLFEVMRLFIKQRDNNKYSRDYARNVYSRIRTNLKQQYQLNSADVIDLIKDNELLKIRYNDEICVPHTLVTEDILLFVSHDTLLLLLIETLCPIC